MLVKRSLLFVFFLLVVCSVHAQLFEQYSSVSEQKYTHLKSYAGISGDMELAVINRLQWQGIEGNPRQIQLNLTSPVYPLQGGVGLHLTSDRIGLRSVVGGGISYNYVYEGDFGLISPGVGFGFKSVTFDRDGLRTPDGLRPGEGGFDPSLTEENLEGSYLNYIVSVLYANGPLEVGLAWYQDTEGSSDIQLQQMPGVLTGYIEYALSVRPDLDVIPYSFVKTSGGQATQIDIGGRFIYLDRFFGGLALRGFGEESRDAVVVNVGFRLSPRLSFSYYYDAGISDLSQGGEGSHEFLLKYTFENNLFQTRPVQVIYNPRY